MSKSSSNEVTVGLFVLVGLACVLYLSVNLGDMELPGNGKYANYNARFLSVQGLKEGGNVMLSGVRIGEIESIDLDNEDYSALVNFKVVKSVQLHDDAIASVKTNGLIGDRYMDLDPGGSGMLLKEGAMIIDTESAIDIESLIGKVAFGGIEEE